MIDWKPGEHDEFRQSLCAGDFDFYVPAEEVKQLRANADALTEDDWNGRIGKTAYYRDLLVLLAPPGLVVTLLRAAIANTPSAYTPIKGALAVIGDTAIQVAVDKLEALVGHVDGELYSKAIKKTIEACAPISHSDVARLMEAVVASKASPAAKRAAKVWIARHEVERAKPD